jgi:hypothetical protein
MSTLPDRIAALDWPRIAADLDARGGTTTGPVLTATECAALADLYAQPALFRSRIVMARHGFGSGEYQYFAAPLPDPVATLRHTLYPRLAPIANAWAARLRTPGYPADHAAFLAACHQAGQTRPTPLLLKYAEGDYNCLHQDLYGDLAFPLQAAFLLSDPAHDFTGGAFVLVEQRPRMQSRAMVVPLRKGDALVFAVNARPVQGTRGPYRVIMRHGVSALRSGHRHTLGLIFHDAT